MDNNEQWLLADLLCCSSINEYVKRNRSSMIKPDLKQYFERLLEEKRLRPREIINESHIEKAYGYQILSGRKRPSRDKLIQLCFGLKLGIHQAQELLFIGEVPTLSAKILHDAIILFALAKGKDIIFADDLLNEWSEKPLQSR